MNQIHVEVACQSPSAILDTISHTARGAVRNTAEVGGEVGTAATGTVSKPINGVNVVLKEPELVKAD